MATTRVSTTTVVVSRRTWGHSDARLFVQLDGERGWIDARDAFFAFPEQARTPMGYGVTAFEAEADATRVDRDGRAWAMAGCRAPRRSEVASAFPLGDEAAAAGEAAGGTAEEGGHG